MRIRKYNLRKLKSKITKSCNSRLLYNFLDFLHYSLLLGKNQSRKFKLLLKSIENHRDHYAENRESGLERGIERDQERIGFRSRRMVRARTRESQRQAACEGTRGKGWTGVAGNKRLANPRRQFNLAANPRENVNKGPWLLPPSPSSSARQHLAVRVC